MPIEKMFADYVQKNMQNKTISQLPKQKLLYVVSLMLKKCSTFQAVEDALLCVLHVSKKSLKNLNNETYKITLLEYYMVKTWLYSLLNTIKQDIYYNNEFVRINKLMEHHNYVKDELWNNNYHSHNYNLYTTMQQNKYKNAYATTSSTLDDRVRNYLREWF